MPGRVTPLSVLVHNPGTTPFGGNLQLHRSTGVASRPGAQLVRPCFLAPGSSRWVQFYPHIADNGQTWVLKWGRRLSERTEITAPRLGAPATVLLAASDTVLGARSKFKMFPDELFPPSVAATDALHAVLLDHMPRWGSQTQEAFADWVRCGGIVHVLRTPQGGAPAFRGRLAFLNSEHTRLRHGAGTVVQHATGAAQSSPGKLARTWPTPKLRTAEAPTVFAFDNSVLMALGRAIQPRHRWGIIHFLTLTYVLLATAVHYLLFRRTRGYATALGWTLALIVVFSAALGAVGRQGYGTHSTALSLAYARPVGDAEYNVTQWTSLFVRKGAAYELTHQSPHNLYATCEQHETVNAAIISGRDGRIVADIPQCSKRTFLHRGRMQGHALNVQILECRRTERLDGLRLNANADVVGTLLEAYAFCDGRFYELDGNSEGELALTRRKGTPNPMSIDEFLAPEKLGSAHLMGLSLSDETENWDADIRKIFQAILPSVIARAQGGTAAFRHYVETLPVAGQPRNVELFLFAAAPAGFKLMPEGFAQETGYTLYHVTLPLPED